MSEGSCVAKFDVLEKKGKVKKKANEAGPGLTI